MTTPNLFDPPTIPVNSTVDAREAKRLSAQAHRILERLRQGPASNRELAQGALNYRARISEIRAAGFNVAVTARDYKTGVALYALVEEHDGRD